MNNTQFISMEQLFHTAGYDYRNLTQEEFIDISDKNIKIKSFNHSTNQIEMRKILKLVRKQDSKVVYVNLKSGENLFKCTLAHRVYLQDLNKYESISNLDTFIALNSANQPIECKVQITDEIHPILDIEVDGNQNYFSNGILSHNTTTGGKALKFYASMRFEIARKETLKKADGEAYGVKTRVKIVKNKVAPPFTECTFDLIFKEGYDYEGSIIEEAVKYNFIQKGGAWFTFKGDKFQGLNGIKNHLKANPTLITELRSQVLDKVNNEGISDVEVKLEDEEVPKRRGAKGKEETSEEVPVEETPTTEEV